MIIPVESKVIKYRKNVQAHPLRNVNQLAKELNVLIKQINNSERSHTQE